MVQGLRQNIVGVGRISGGRLAQAWNGLLLACLSVQRRLKRKLPIGYPFFIRQFGRNARLFVEQGSDFAVLREVFIEDQYRIDLPQDPGVIVDLGGNVGFSAIYFALRFPRATIFVVEPEPDNFRRLCRNVKAFPNIRPFQLAVAGQPGSLTLFTDPHSGMSASLVPRPGYREVHVPAVTLDQFLERQGIHSVDLLKFDIEGAELDVFRHATCLPRVAALIGEVHEDLMPGSWADFVQLFRPFEVQTQPTAPRRRLMVAVRGGQPRSPEKEKDRSGVSPTLS